MHKKLTTTSGFTLIELVITIAIFATISVGAIWMVFTTISLRDKASATIRSQESLRVFIQSLHSSVSSATAITSTTNTIQITSPGNCLSFTYNQAAQALYYGVDTLSNCTPPAASTTYFDSSTKVESLTFSLLSLPTGGRQVHVQGTLTTYLPLESYQLNFTESFVNLID